MSTLQYMGKSPAVDSDSTVCPKSYADSQAAAAVVTTTQVNQQISSQAAALTIQSHVDANNATVVKKTDVIAADAAYVPATQRGAANGVAALDSSSSLIVTQRPTSGLVTDRVGVGYSYAAPAAGLLGQTISSVPGSIGTQLLASGSVTVVSSSVPGTELGTVTIPDPGWPWRPIPRGFVPGNAAGASSQPPDRMSGTGVSGVVYLMPLPTVSSQIYGVALCTGSPYTNSYPIVSYAGTSQTPSTVPAITGSLTLNLYGSCLSGTNYTFLAAGFVFWVDVVASI